MNKKIKINFTMSLFVLIFSGLTSASLHLDDIYFDPAIVSAGDNVDIVVQYSVDPSGSNNWIANEDYTFDVKLRGDDTLTEKYVTIVDAEGDNLAGIVFAGQHYNKVFRIKVADNAPVGDYQFELAGQWYRNGIALSSFQTAKFIVPVKKEGVVLGVAGFSVEPSEVRPGDDYVELKAYVDNSGEKAAKSVEVSLDLPEGFSASYSDNNRVWVGQLGAGESRVVSFYVNVAEEVEEGVYDFNYNFEFRDSENNDYVGEDSVEFFVKAKPNIEVIAVEGEGARGSSSKLYVTVKNVGSETAEAVDVRILKQSSQPFDFDVRSDYVGELLPGEEGLAVFDIDVKRSAEKKEYDLKLLIRAKGDSDIGDDNVYVFNRRAKFEVVGSWFNVLLIIGLAGALIVVLNFLWKKKKGGKFNGFEVNRKRGGKRR